MKIHFIFFILVGAIFYSERDKILALIKLAKIPVAIVQTPECSGKKKCSVIYVAPWCPACNSMIPQLQALLEVSQNHPDFGVQVIVGNGKTMIENQMKAQEIGGRVITDDEAGSYAKILRITYFPTILVFDQNGKVLAKDTDAMIVLNETFSK